jgi:hypothetical protein
MSKKYLLIFYTSEPKPPELYWDSTEDMAKLFARIVELTKNRAKFTVNEVGECVGDFS